MHHLGHYDVFGGVFAIIENKHKSGPINPQGNFLPFKEEFDKCNIG